MSEQFLGQSCAILTALTWAFALILFKKSGEHISPLALNLFKNSFGLLMLLATLPIFAALGLSEGISILSRHSPRDIGILLLSGFIGIALADTIFFHALNRIGVGIAAIVDCFYSPSIIFFSFFMLHERLGCFQWLGAALILSGLLVSSRLKPPRNRTRAQLIAGILLGSLSMALMGFGIVLAKPVLERFDLVWATTIRLVSGTFSLIAIGMLLPDPKALFAVFRPSPAWKWCVPGSILGAYFSLIFWVAGFKYIDASVAAILNQTSSVFALILATLILKEDFTFRKLLAITLAVSGVVLVTFNSALMARFSPVP